MSETLRIHRIIDCCESLGPGRRAVVTVQGCSLGCPGCAVPYTHDPDGGEEVAVPVVFERLRSLGPLDGLTLLGGEPMEQAGALCALVALVRAGTDWTVFTYTGWRVEDLIRGRDPDRLRLLADSDMVCDGPFVAALAEPGLLWRGSTNQRIFLFSAAARGAVARARERPVVLDLALDPGRILLLGVDAQRTAAALDLSFPR